MVCKQQQQQQQRWQ